MFNLCCMGFDNNSCKIKTSLKQELSNNFYENLNIVLMNKTVDCGEVCKRCDLSPPYIIILYTVLHLPTKENNLQNIKICRNSTYSIRKRQKILS